MISEHVADEETKTECPCCRGCGQEHRLLAGSGSLRRLGLWEISPCRLCLGQRRVTASEAAYWRRAVAGGLQLSSLNPHEAMGGLKGLPVLYREP